MTNKYTMPLFFIRVSIALVLLVWTLDKFINPSHSSAVFGKFFFLPGLGETTFLIIGIAELVLIGLFLIGRFKNITYLLVLIIHAVSTLTPFMNYFSPFEGANLLFFTSWPMLAACYALYKMRDEDTKFNL